MTGSRSALARHVGPPGPVRRVPVLPPPPAEAEQDDADRMDQADTQVLVRPAPPVETAAGPDREPPATPARDQEAPAPPATSRRLLPDEPEPVPVLQRASPLAAVAGAALAVCGVALGISALLWAQPAPPEPREPAAITSVEQDAGAVVTAGATTAPAPSAAASPAPAPSPAPPPPPPSPAPSPTPAPPALEPVTVLNNSRIDGLAARAAARFAAAGWPVAETGNYRGRLSATTVFYAPGQEAAARAFAARFPGVARVQPRTATLPGRGLTVVLTRDFR